MSAIIGLGTQSFYRIYREVGLDPRSVPVGSLSLAETEASNIGRDCCADHFTAATYFGSVASQASLRFREAFLAPFRRGIALQLLF